MATNKHGNMIFTDAAADFLNEKVVLRIIVHCTHASTAADIELTNGANASGPTLWAVEIPAASDYADFDFSSSPLYFPDGIGIKTVSNAEITIVIDRNRERL